MTPEKQRIAIAEACGWKCFGHPDQILATKNWQFAHQFVISSVGEIVSHNSIPQYLDDLNAMHEAEKVLWDTGKAMEFTNQLVGIVCSARGFRWDKGTSDDHLMCLSHATAAQRCEAFLRTVGKWEEAT